MRSAGWLAIGCAALIGSARRTTASAPRCRRAPSPPRPSRP